MSDPDGIDPDEKLHDEQNAVAEELYNLLQASPVSQLLTGLGACMLISTLVDDLITPEAPLEAILEAIRRGALHVHERRAVEETR